MTEPQNVIVENTDQRMQHAATVPVPRQLFDSIITEGINVISSYTDSGKSYFLRGLLYHLATDHRVPGVAHDLGDKHLKVTYIDPEQPQSNLKHWATIHSTLPQEQREQAAKNILEIRSPKGFVNDPEAFREVIRKVAQQGTHNDVCLLDSHAVLYARGYDQSRAAEMDGIVSEIFEDLKAFKTIVMTAHITRTANYKKRDQVPEPEGSTHFVNQIQGNMITMLIPTRDSTKRIFVHTKQKDRYGKTSYAAHRPSFVLDTNIDSLTPWSASKEILTYSEWMQEPTPQDETDQLLKQLYMNGATKEDVINEYKKMRNCKEDSARRQINRYETTHGVNFNLPLHNRVAPPLFP